MSWNLVLRYRIEAHRRWKWDLRLLLDAGQASRLADWVEPALQGSERSITLHASSDETAPAAGGDPAPSGTWRVFFKTRDADNRLLLAHPDADSWVATVALEAATMQALLASLRGGRSERVDRLAAVHPLSNVHLSWDVT